MKTLARIIITLLAIVVCNFFILWISYLSIPGLHKIKFLPNLVSLAIAIIIGLYVWKKSKFNSNSRLSYILMGGLIIGSISFILGFIGPLILTPSNNLGPLLGIFITGPIGFLVGLVAGGIYWNTKVKNQ